MDERIEAAQRAGEQAIFGGDGSGLDEAEHGLDGVQADLDLARGRLLHARYVTQRRENPPPLGLFQSAADRYRALGDGRGEAQALFMVGTWHQVIGNDNVSALPHFVRARDLAADVGDRLTLSYALRHLAYISLSQAHFDDARHQMQLSTDLRRAENFVPGVTMNLLGLAEIEAAAGDHASALKSLDQAERLAAETANPGLTDLTRRVRDSLTAPATPGAADAHHPD